ncbi:polysaccharide deacetylase family protein [uncultured Dysosmobacter sp.]|uniref:polysaccharide deacetylase family protein n=1 Tax=uncultured Dysosmobacter sp. TaxID=2591384 RepID=UPI00262771BB|nr:polysaccharide deacetylase family protein [uncultured Dysosmobacter sp.]
MRKQWLLALTALAALALLARPGERQAVPADGTAELAAETHYIALTFDDGPRHDTTARLLDGLRQRGASATFFLVGEQAQANPELVERMEAEGHQVGNHTWSHVRLEGASREAVAEEVARTEAFLSQLLGGNGYWLRPPYGLITAGTENQITVPMVKWSVDPRDWESRNTAKVVQAVLEAVRPNSIILLHDIYPTSVEAALQVVDTLQAQGYVFVTVEELLYLNGVRPQPGVMYRTGKG